MAYFKVKTVLRSTSGNKCAKSGGGQLAQEQEIVPSKNPEYTIKIYTYMLTIL